MKDLEGRLRIGPVPRGAVPPAVERLTRAAGDLVDVAYGPVDSPIGPLLVAVTRRGLVRIGLDHHDRVLAELSARLSPRMLEAPARLDPVRGQLDEYFAGDRHRFDIPFDWSLITGFRAEVLRATARIPYGQTSSYGAIAAALGKPGAARAAGQALGGNPIPIVIPCHRVVRAGGGLGGYAGGTERKEILLRLEGASI